MDYKSLSISDLKAIIDYCDKEKRPFFFSFVGETNEQLLKREKQYDKYETLQSEAESELSLRLGIQ